MKVLNAISKIQSAQGFEKIFQKSREQIGKVNPFQNILPFEQKGLAKQIVHTSLARNIKKGGVIKMFKIKKIKLNQNFINLVGIHRCFIAYSNNDDEYWFFFHPKKKH